MALTTMAICFRESVRQRMAQLDPVTQEFIKTIVRKLMAEEEGDANGQPA
jgi:hypothetical protein